MEWIKQQYFKLVLLLIAIFCLNNTNAQNSAEFQVWESYNVRMFIPKYRIWWRNDLQLRQAIKENPTNVFMFRTRLYINLGDYFQFEPGVDFHYTNYKEYDYITEIRTFQGIGLHWPNLGRFTFDHLYRFEQRFFNVRNETEIGLRSRYRLLVRMPINNTSMTNKTFYSSLRSEFFFPHDKEIKEIFANTIRVGLELGYNSSPYWRYYFTLMIDHGKNEYSNDRTKDNYILSLSVRHVLKNKQKDE